MDAIIEKNPIGNEGNRARIMEDISIPIEILVHRKLKDKFKVYNE